MTRFGIEGALREYSKLRFVRKRVRGMKQVQRFLKAIAAAGSFKGPFRGNRHIFNTGHRHYCAEPDVNMSFSANRTSGLKGTAYQDVLTIMIIETRQARVSRETQCKSYRNQSQTQRTGTGTCIWKDSRRTENSTRALTWLGKILMADKESRGDVIDSYTNQKNFLLRQDCHLVRFLRRCQLPKGLFKVLVKPRHYFCCQGI